MPLLRSPLARSPRAGFSVVELCLAGTVLMVGLLGTLGTISTVNKLCEANRESTLAYQGARTMMERLQSEPFSGVLASYNLDLEDDLDGLGTGPGPSFAVPGLTAQAGDADGFPGRVLLPLAEDGTLREDLVDAAFGLPRDLNGDGEVDHGDRTDDHVMLPVRVRVEWNGKSGDRVAEFSTLLCLRR